MCLAKGLRQRGHHVVILDHDSNRVNLTEWKCALQPVLPTPVPASDRPLYREKIEKFFKAFEGMPLSARFPLDDTSQMDEYDMVVVGSDEVWNLSHPWYGCYPVFYGDNLRAKRLISYAASFGNYQSSWGLEPEWAQKLYQFESISTRDDNSFQIIKDALGFEPAMVLDPCLQFPVEPNEYEPVNIDQPYVAVYGHNFSGYFIQKIKEWAAEKQVKMISIGYRNDWADEQWLTAGPHEFAAFMAGAEAVVTNFFHGCVFALINGKPFTCETSHYRSNKVQGLMKTIGGSHHLVVEDTPSATYADLLSAPPAIEIYENIARLREASNAYLDSALAPKEYQLT